MNQPLVVWEKQRGEQHWIAHHGTSTTLVVSNPLRMNFPWSLQHDDKVITGGVKSNLPFAQQAAEDALLDFLTEQT
jgi:hypothetical protein